MTLQFSQKDILEHGVTEIIGQKELQSALNSGKKLKIKLGIDPTSPNIHLGRSIPIWRLRAFQELGHEIHLIIGDFTGQIGDASDKESERPMLSEETVRQNMQAYEEQLWMILNPDKKDQVVFHHNSEWLSKLTLAEISQMADVFSVNNFIKRELVAKRLESGSRVSLREVLYPLLQGYDSVILQSNVEIGGTDQRFNLLAGRDLQSWAGQEPQSVITSTLISGTDGRKMSSSWGNVIALRDLPEDKFGKMMSVKDDCMADFLLTIPLSAQPFTESEMQDRMDKGENPRDLKLELAWTLVALYHGEDAANKCKEDFIFQFSEGNKPVDITTRSVKKGDWKLVDLMVEVDLASSKSEARRLVQQGGVRVDDQKMEDFEVSLNITDTPVLLNVGKRNYIEIVGE